MVQTLNKLAERVILNSEFSCILLCELFEQVSHEINFEVKEDKMKSGYYILFY